MSIFSKKTKKADVPVKSETAVSENKPAAGHAIIRTVLKKPWLTERANLLLSQNKYVFLVDENATKPAVREEVQRRYGVRVLDVNIINRAGKMKRYRYKMNRRETIKKAIVTLKAGDKIEVE